MTIQDLLSTLDGEVVATIREDDTDLVSIRAAGWNSLDEDIKKKEVKKWSLKNFAHIIVKTYAGGGAKELRASWTIFSTAMWTAMAYRTLRRIRAMRRMMIFKK